jgi:hypothetical protein
MRTLLFGSFLSLVIIGSLFTPNAGAAQEDVDVLIACPKPYGGTMATIMSLGGTVRFQYNNIDALAVTIPKDQVHALQGLPEVKAFVKDRTFTRSQGPSLVREGFGEVFQTYELDGSESSGDASEFIGVAPEGYFPTDAALTRATDVWNTSGHFGEGVIVGIMDSGTADVAAISGRVLGGTSYLSATPALDDGLGPNDPGNGAHGTWVATTVGANAIFGFFSTSTFAQSVASHMPAAILPDFFGPGIDGIPMVGQAPSAEFYALKIFNRFGQTSNSIILAAFDGAIDLKTSGTVDLGVINGSFGGGTLFAAGDPFFAWMVQELTDAGIVVVFSAGNGGPSGATGGDPGVSMNSLAVASTNYPAYERVLRDLQGGLGLGNLFRPNSIHQTTLSSARGPTADGRIDPDLAAPGFAIYAQAASGAINIVSGTSFAAPQAAGAAALVLSAFPAATPDQVRAALMQGANPNLLQDNSGPLDQGHGFLDVQGAFAAMLAGAPNPDDTAVATKRVSENFKRAADIGVIRDEVFETNTGALLPGQRVEYFVNVKKTTKRLTVNLSNIVPELPADQQNQLFGDDIVVAIHSAKTHLGDYRVFGFVPPPGGSIFLQGSDLDHGVARVTILGDWTNAGNISADVQIFQESSGQEQGMHESGKLAHNESAVFEFEVPVGAEAFDMRLVWDKDWGSYPTNDLDMLVFDPSFNLIVVDNDGDGDPDGISLDAPERLHIDNPDPGTWFIIVDAFTIWNVGKGTGRSDSRIDPNTLNSPTQVREDTYNLYVSVVVNDLAKTTQEFDTPERIGGKMEFRLGQSAPNPFGKTSTINYSLAREGQVSVRIFNARGQIVRTLVDGLQAPGAHTVSWNGQDDLGRRLPSGTYLYQMRSGEFVETRKMIKLD